MLNTKPYRIEVHKKDFSYVAHFFVDTLMLVDDYLSPDENTVEVPVTNIIERGQWIHIARGGFQFFGIISSVRHDVEITTIGFRPFNSIFTYPVLFNTALQNATDSNQQALEVTIANLIASEWRDTTDSTKRLSYLEIVTTSATKGWTFYIDPDNDYTTYAITNFFDELIRPAMEQFYIAVNATPDFRLKKITVSIGKVNSFGVVPYAFEADLPNVVGRNVGVYTDSAVINKLIVYNSDDFTEAPIVWYKHPDGTFDLDDRDRMYPVIYDIETASETEDVTFEYAALERAISRFVMDSDSNLIELTYLQNDSLTADFETVYGRPVTVHSGDKAYQTILTGIETDEEAIKYIFGVVRLDLTKELKRRKYNG